MRKRWLAVAFFSCHCAPVDLGSLSEVRPAHSSDPAGAAGEGGAASAFGGLSGGAGKGGSSQAQAGRGGAGSAGEGSEQAGAAGAGGQPEPMVTPPSPEVLAWEPCRISSVLPTTHHTYVGCSDGRMFMTSATGVPAWTRIDVTPTPVGESRLPAAAVTAIVSTDYDNEGGLLVGMARLEPGAGAVLFQTSRGGGTGWSAVPQVSLNEPIVGLSRLEDASVLAPFIAATAREGFSTWGGELIFESSKITSAELVTFGPLQGLWFGAAESLYRLPEGESATHEETWIKLPLTSTHEAISGITSVAELETIFVAPGRGPILYSVDGGVSWREPELFPPTDGSAVVTRVSFNPAHPRTVYACLVTAEQVTSLRSDDAGRTWGPSR